LKAQRDKVYRMEIPLTLTGRDRPPAGQKAKLDVFLKMNTEGRDLRNPSTSGWTEPGRRQNLRLSVAWTTRVPSALV